MSAQFTPRMAFRLLSGPLLKEYFQARGRTALLTIGETGQFDIHQLYQQWMDLPSEVRNPMEAELRAVHEMASSDTDLSTVLQEAEFQGHAEELRQAFAQLNSLQDKMLWTLLKYPRIFEVANLFEQTEYLSARSWRKRAGLPKREPRTDAKTLRNLEAMLRDYYINREGRGQGCHVEPYKKGDEIYYYVYLEDYARLGVTFDSHGDFQRQPLKDSFEIIFRFNPLEGVLETFVRGQRRLVEDVQVIFARVCLDGAELTPSVRAIAAYDFNKLRHSIAFPTDSEDGVVSTRVKSLRLWFMGSKRKIALEEGDATNPDGIYDLLDTITADEAAGKLGLQRALLNVTRAELQMVFRREGKRNKTLTFAISWPDSCNLRDKPEHLIARKYLKRWGLELHGASQNTPELAVAGG